MGVLGARRIRPAHHARANQTGVSNCRHSTATPETAHAWFTTLSKCTPETGERLHGQGLGEEGGEDKSSSLVPAGTEPWVEPTGTN